MGGALGVVVTPDVLMAGQHAQPVYVDDSLPIVGPSRAVYVVTSGDVPPMGGPPIPVRLAPAGTPAVGPALPIYVVAGGGYLPSMYGAKVLSTAPGNLLAYWPLDEVSGTTITDRSGNGRNGVSSNFVFGQTGPDGRPVAGFNATSSFGNLYSASLAAAFNGQEGSASMWCRVASAGVWTDGSTRRALYLLVDANNRVGFLKPTSNNEIDSLYVAGGTSLGAGKTSFSPTDWFHLGLTWSKANNQMIMYVNGVAITPISTGLGTFAGSLSTTQTVLGSLSTTPAQLWSGNQADVAVWSTPLSAATMAALAVR